MLLPAVVYDRYVPSWYNISIATTYYECHADSWLRPQDDTMSFNSIALREKRRCFVSVNDLHLYLASLQINILLPIRISDKIDRAKFLG